MIRRMHRSGQWVFHSISPFFKLFLETEIDLTGTFFALRKGRKRSRRVPSTYNAGLQPSSTEPTATRSQHCKHDKNPVRRIRILQHVRWRVLLSAAPRKIVPCLTDMLRGAEVAALSKSVPQLKPTGEAGHGPALGKLQSSGRCRASHPEDENPASATTARRSAAGLSYSLIKDNTQSYV